MTDDMKAKVRKCATDILENGRTRGTCFDTEYVLMAMAKRGLPRWAWPVVMDAAGANHLCGKQESDSVWSF